MKRAVLLPILLLLAACGGHELAEAKGPVFALNPGRWTPSAQDLALARGPAGTEPAAPPFAGYQPAGPAVLNR